jgi:hypothetical protein
MKTVLSNTLLSTVSQTQAVVIVDPCTLSNGNLITPGTVLPMTISALLVTPSETQTLSYWTDTASSNAGVRSMCGASTFSLVAGTYAATYLALSGNILTLKSTVLADIGIHNVDIK